MSGTAGASVLKEFLATISFQTDQGSLRNFVGSLGTATAGAVKLGLAVEAAALAVVGAVSVIASNFEQLYYTSQRVGASAQNLLALQFGMRQIGLSAQDATAAVTGMAMAVRMNPQLVGMLTGLGVRTMGANGAPRDETEIFRDLVKGLEVKYPQSFWARAQVAAMFGISSSTLLQMEQNPGLLEAGEKRFLAFAKQAGVDITKLTKDSRNYENSLRDVGGIFDFLKMKVESVLIENMGPDIKTFTKYATDNFDEISRTLGNLLTALEKVAVFITENFIGGLTVIEGLFSKMDEATNGWSTAIMWVLIPALAALGLALSMGPIGATLVIIGAIITGIGYIKAHMPDVGGWLKWMQGGLGGDSSSPLFVDPATGRPLNKDGSIDTSSSTSSGGVTPVSGAASPDLTSFVKREEGFDPKSKWDYHQYSSGYGTKASGPNEPITREEAERRLATELARHGANIDRAAKAVGLALTSGQRDALTDFDYNTGAGEKVISGSGGNLAKILSTMMQYIHAGGEVSEGLVRRRGREAALFSSQRPGGDVAMNQTTTINVNGAGDPHSVATRVAQIQRDVNNNITRNFSSALDPA
jgi:GH24 family phage-related lysozyme (muramidase)